MALAVAQGEAKQLAKSARNPQHNYAYAPIEEFVDEARRICAPQGLALLFYEDPASYSVEILTTQRGGTMRLVSGVCFLRAIHTSGEWVEIEIMGEASDTSDKAPWKYVTNARKYLLASLLNLSVGEDSEQDSHQIDGPAQPQPQQRRAAPKASSTPKPDATRDLYLTDDKGEIVTAPGRPDVKLPVWWRDECNMGAHHEQTWEWVSQGDVGGYRQDLLMAHATGEKATARMRARAKWVLDYFYAPEAPPPEEVNNDG